MSDDGGGGDYLYDLMRGRADPAGLAQESDQRVIDLGHDVLVMFTSRDGARVGLLESHPRPDDGRGCSGAVTFDVPEAEGLKGPRWQVESMDPLTISPSVLCRGCGWHGWIRGGQWVPA